MIKRTNLIFLVTFGFLISNAFSNESTCEKSPLVKGECFTVIGSFYCYNGWPPYLRIESKEKKLYGVGPWDNELIPQSIYEILPAQIEGEFEVCPLGYPTSVPYEERGFEIVCIKSVRNAWYWDGETGERKELNR